MAKYEVIRNFIDLQDNRKFYKKGQTYPRPANKKVDYERIMDLTTSDNRRGVALIKKV